MSEQIEHRRRIEPPQFSWLACMDCDSAIYDRRPAPGHGIIEVEHSDTCPNWRESGPEVALELLPRGVGNDH